MYQAFVSRLRATQDSSADQMADARVISRAPVPDAPDGPRKLFMILAAIPASLLLGLLAALIAERLEASRVSFAGAPVMARIPVSQTRLSDDVIDRPQSPQARAVSELADALLPHGAGGRAVLIAPAAPGGSQTDLTVALARSAARNGRRVIVIDGNFRNPRMAQAVGVTGQNGLVAALTGRLRLSQCVYRDTRSPAFMLGCSQGLHNPSQLLASPAMAQLVAHLRGACDLVLIESGPVPASNDAVQLARLCDMAVLVVHNTPRNVAAAAFRELAGTARQTAQVAMEPRHAA
jgi:Mrp family chromosome partitioning ATPase